jgi:hypothetical protein
MALQPHPMTSVMQLSITAASLCVAAAAVIFAIRSTSDERNARLVEIGVAVLRVDPTKDTQVAAARQWALDLIDANAGGVKFSPTARSELLERRLDYSTPISNPGYTDYSGYSSSGGDYSSHPGDYSSHPNKTPEPAKK